MTIRLMTGDVLKQLALLPDNSVHCVVTSPPYWGLRNYGVEGQLGLERTLGEHIENMVKVFREIRRVLRRDGTCWLNYGDCYATTANGRSAADTKSASKDDRTFRDKPFSTIGPVYPPTSQDPFRRDMGRRGDGRASARGNLKPKDLCMIPNRLAIALQDDGWWVRSEIIWHKPNPMPESIIDRPATAHEKVFLLSKNGGKPIIWRARDTGEWSHKPKLKQRIKGADGKRVPRWRGFDYFYDEKSVRRPFSASTKNDPRLTREGYEVGRPERGFPGQPSRGGGLLVRKTDKQRGHSRRHAGFNERWDGMERNDQLENGANLKNVWTMATRGFPDAHFATFPPELPETCIKAGCPIGGMVLDPFGGAGTTGLVADRLNRNAILIELNPEYVKMAEKRLMADAPLFVEIEKPHDRPKSHKRSSKPLLRKA